jgi:2-keto-4-pentenoate hydratase/2-oxohepta-3-ene-1,7-dioic acid hydratase in catechol pathway
MKLATLRDEHGDESLHYFHANHFIAVEDVATVYGAFFSGDLLSVLETGEMPDMLAWWNREADERLPRMPEFSCYWTEARFAPLYRRPRKIWGIGLNYQNHAADLDEVVPAREPASFLKPDTTIIGAGDAICLPSPDLTTRVTGEAELAIIIGRTCRNVPPEEWLSAVAGFTTVLDMTAEDILRRNPRNLTQAKSFDTFFSFGPLFVTPDEIPGIDELLIQTVLNGEVRAENTVAHMTFSPADLVAYHSRIMTLLPGDIISTGTPGAAVLTGGDTLECRIPDSPFLSLVNSVANSGEKESLTAANLH